MNLVNSIQNNKIYDSVGINIYHILWQFKTDLILLSANNVSFYIWT